MPSPGARIGPFEIGGLLGRGGMGEVYRAYDTRLQREVALKLLPPQVAGDHAHLARFTREAHALAALNHPHIAAIYGVEENASGVALVLELVDGPTLAERIAQGPLSVDEAISVGRQIAAALEAAHEHGIIHRDLKPANIKLRPDGTVKVLDFGLAKTFSAPHGVNTDFDGTPTPTFSAHTTALGVILGTVAYMAPEQASGRTVDRRADIWAFGVVLFEMLAGTRPFSGQTTTETMAAILKDPPTWPALPHNVPGSLRSLIKRTLEKDPRRRLRDIGDARIELEDLESGAHSGITGVDARPRSSIRALPWMLAALVSAAAIAGAWRFSTPQAAEAPPLKYTLPIDGAPIERTGLPAISPDGAHVVFVKGGMLWVRSLDQFEPRPLSGTNGAQCPFWSPDSRQVAYLAGTTMWRVGLTGSQPDRVARYQFSKGGRTPGGVWLPDGTIAFAPASRGTGLFTVPAQGGDFTELYKPDPKVEGDLHRPSLLPDGRTLLFVVDRLESGADTIGILSNGARKDVLTVKGELLDSPVYSPSGHLLYHRETTSPGVWAVPFSLARLEATGPPFLVAALGSYPSISLSGLLVYPENSVSAKATLAWFDQRTGAVTSAFTEEFPTLTYPRLSPSGRYVAAVVQAPGEGRTVIVADLQRHTHVRLDDRADPTSHPAWRDDRTVVYARNEGFRHALVMRAADGSGEETVLAPGMHPSVASGHLVFSVSNIGTGSDLYQLLLPPGGAPGPATPLQRLPEHETESALSPDGTLLAYTSGDAGQSQVILATYPSMSGRWQVSAAGGSSAVWSPHGDALYYRDPSGQILRVSVNTTSTVTLGVPQSVSRTSALLARFGFDVSSDGRLLVVRDVKTDEPRAPSVAVVQNWFAAFRKSGG